MSSISDALITIDDYLQRGQEALNITLNKLLHVKAQIEEQERSAINDILKSSSADDVDFMKLRALTLVRTRRRKDVLVSLTSYIQTVVLDIRTKYSLREASQAFNVVVQSLDRLYRLMPGTQMAGILWQFKSHLGMIDRADDFGADVVSAQMEHFDDVPETIVAQVLSELGVSLGDQLAGLPQVR